MSIRRQTGVIGICWQIGVDPELCTYEGESLLMPMAKNGSLPTFRINVECVQAERETICTYNCTCTVICGLTQLERIPIYLKSVFEVAPLGCTPPIQHFGFLNNYGN